MVESTVQQRQRESREGEQQQQQNQQLQHKSRRRKQGRNLRQFSSYLSCSAFEIICIAIFLITYVLVLVILSPLLYQEAPQNTNIKRGQVLKPVFDRVRNRISPKLELMAGTIKKHLDQFRKAHNISDASLIEQVDQEIANLRHKKAAGDANNRWLAEAQHNSGDISANTSGNMKRSGFMVLGMHRSGTSMLSGLLVLGLGYNVGGPLIRQGLDNKKGFFELISAVLQNDEFMNLQGIWWAANVLNYNDDLALQHYRDGTAKFHHGTEALKFLNDPNNAPYLQKDPRMCITLKTWLPLLNNEPAIVFTYRHPLEVAMSLHKREQSISVEHGLRIWIVYNMRAIQNSANLCRVLSSNEAVLANPLEEVTRISNELTTKCGVPAPPLKLTKDIVDTFVDPTMQHSHKKSQQDTTNKEIIATYNNGDCVAYDLPSKYTAQYDTELAMYLKAMQIYCDFKSGKIYQENYEWPPFTTNGRGVAQQ